MADQTPSKQEKSLKVGQKVEIVKDSQAKLRGAVAYVGTTSFSPGKWIGVVLDEPKGKNNGTVMGKYYFSCKEGHGMFVRQTNCIPLDDIPEESESPAVEDKQKAKSRLPVATPKTPAPAAPQPVAPTHPETPVLKDETPSVPATPRGEVQKRSSFIETGFVETLKTQFTPGQPLSPSLSLAIEERVTVMQLQHDNDNLKAEIRDLQEKLETLKIKRNQDREKLKEADKIRLQLDQLLEFKKAILESQAQLQKELQRAKQEAKDAILEKQAKIDESNEYQEMVEMATLDKEMAEEKAESLQIELEQAKQKIEELTLDLELLKAEMGDKGIEGAGSSVQIKQLEQQNSRLKDTLVKMRDLAAHEKHQQQCLQKDLEQRAMEITDLNKAKQALALQVEEQLKVIAELQEQVDAALGAEEMVEQLTDRNLALEEKITELQEAVADLEQLHEMNEELQETARETELELREELDMARTKIREVTKERDASQEMVADRNTTIEKFREVVQQLQNANQELREALQRETKKPVGAPPEVIDYKKMFTETKTFTKTIDLELRKLDVQQALQHVQYLCTYMPDSFMARGGDHDSVQILLLISRLLFKCDILAAQVKEKFPQPEKWDISSVKSHAAERFSFGARLLHSVFTLQSIARQYSNALNVSTPEQFLKIGTLYPEMTVQEKTVDFYVELLRKDQLDENINLEALEKSTAYFTNIYFCYFSDVAEGFTLLTDQAKVIIAACDCLTADSNRIQIMIQAGHEGSDVAMAVKDILNQTVQWQQYARTIKRRLPTDGSSGPINLPNDIILKLYQAQAHAAKLLKILQEWCRLVTQQLSIVTEMDTGVPVAKMRELAHAAADKIYIDDDSSDGGFFENVRTSLAFVSGTFSALSTALVDGHYDFDGTPANTALAPPVALRAQLLKAEIKDLENLRHKLEQREMIIKEVNLLLRNKQEELSEMNVRKEMAEKKLANVIRENEVALEKLTRKLEDSQLLLKRKEKEFHETVEHLQSDMETLEREKAELKERLMNSSKKVLLEGLTKSTTSLSSPVSLLSSTHSLTSSLVADNISVARDSPMLLSELAHLREALKVVQLENSKLVAEKVKTKMDLLKPLIVPKKSLMTSSDNDLNSLLKKAESLKLTLLGSCSQSKVIDLTKKDSHQAVNELKQQTVKSKQIQHEISQLQMSVARFVAARTPGAEIRTKMASFPIPELSKTMKESEPVTVGHLVLPVPDKTAGKQPISIVLEAKELKELHLKLLP